MVVSADLELSGTCHRRLLHSNLHDIWEAQLSLVLGAEEQERESRVLSREVEQII